MSGHGKTKAKDRSDHTACATDTPGPQLQMLLDMHRCKAPNGQLRYAGPAYFVHFLSWTGAAYQMILQRLECCGRIHVQSGMAADRDIPLTQGSPECGQEWVADCGRVTLCHNCAEAVVQLASGWEKFSVADVIARHLAAAIGLKFLGQPSVDSTFVYERVGGQ